jgi:hypothetical protein
MFSNIPITQTKHIIKNQLRINNTNTHIKSELLDWYEAITQQNYSRHKDTTITQTDGLAMGAPSSSIISEIFLQHTEHTHLPRLTQKHKLINYVRYVDDILILFDPQLTDLHSLLRDFNFLLPNVHFTEEIEQNNSINNVHHKTVQKHKYKNSLPHIEQLTTPPNPEPATPGPNDMLGCIATLMSRLRKGVHRTDGTLLQNQE